VAIPSLPLVDLVVGLALLTLIGLVATRVRLARQSHVRWLVGWVLVAVPLPVVVAARWIDTSSVVGGEVAFLCGVVAFAVGAALVLSGRDERDHGSGPHLDPEPWWPDFEREFRAYARTRSRRRVRI
jgi:hypothetical protein